MGIRTLAVAALAISAAAAHAQAPERAWETASNGAVHYLRYQSPDGDAALELQCIGPRATEVSLRVYGAGPSEPRRAFLRSGAVRAAAAGRIARADPEPDTFLARIPARAPVLAAFERTGALQVQVGGRRAAADAAPGPSREAVARFFRQCRS